MCYEILKDTRRNINETQVSLFLRFVLFFGLKSYPILFVLILFLIFHERKLSVLLFLLLERNVNDMIWNSSVVELRF